MNTKMKTKQINHQALNAEKEGFDYMVKIPQQVMHFIHKNCRGKEWDEQA